MSFTTKVKNEISNNYNNSSANMAELSAILRNSYLKELNNIEITTENSTVCKHIYTLFKEIYNINVKTEFKDTKFSKNRLYIITVLDKLEIILKDLAVISENNEFLDIPSEYLINSEDEKRAYLKGTFLMTGSINDPKTSMYHLEFFIDYLEEANFFSNLLNEFYLNSKVIEREKGYMVYIKEAEKIGDFLRIIGANLAVMYYEDIRIYRDHKNMTNRLNNCEQANIEKSMLTSSKQIEDINLIIEKLGLDFVDSKIEEVINYRLKYPETSLQELSEIMTIETGKQITKSGLNHRFRKIKELATRIRENKED
ncbi:MAG: DNA-binding protein WhiA [Bacilli bacterium]|nr:DNA-binding protein WhiA [Bacilli bacterium]